MPRGSTLRSLGSGRNSSSATPLIPSSTCHSSLAAWALGSAEQRHAAAAWRAWQRVFATLMTDTQSPDADTLFTSTPQLRAQLAQLQTTLSRQMTTPAFLLKPLGPALRTTTIPKKGLSHPFNHNYTNKSLTATPQPLSAQPYSSLNRHPTPGAHLLQTQQRSP